MVSPQWSSLTGSWRRPRHLQSKVVSWLILTQIAPGLYFEKYWTKGWKINLIFKIALIDKMLFLFKVKHKPLSSCT